MNTDDINGYGAVFRAFQPAEKEDGRKMEEDVDAVFEKISEMQKRIAAKKIADMENALEKLEHELTEMIGLHADSGSER